MGLSPSGAARTDFTNEASVSIHIKLSNEDFGTAEDRDRIFALQDELVRALESQCVGLFDGDEWGQGFCTLFLLGRSVSHLASLAHEILHDAGLGDRASVDVALPISPDPTPLRAA